LSTNIVSSGEKPDQRRFSPHKSISVSRVSDGASLRFPALKIAGVHHGHFDHAAGSPENESVIEEINAAKPQILVVGFGMPRQERWLMENWDRVNANVALAGGAVFDYVSGRLRREPRLLIDNGFEWLARLLVQPARLWRRYLLATRSSCCGF
jgi:N-acetylglucosaminyldiphosphoundecaprenol N-acetyl-beta-D-mannosaminyltransferase